MKEIGRVRGNIGRMMARAMAFLKRKESSETQAPVAQEVKAPTIRMYKRSRRQRRIRRASIVRVSARWGKKGDRSYRKGFSFASRD